MKNKLLISFGIFILSVSSAFGFQTKVLPSGQTVVIEQVKNNPIVIIDTWVKTGSINENDKNTGVSHFLEHLLFKGSEKYKTGEFDKILESKGGIINAATSKDFTHFYIQIPAKYFDTALDLHADMLINPVIPNDELEKERLVVIEEISKDVNNPHQKVYDNFTGAFYTSHPYKRKVIGTEDVIANISKKEILDYFKTYYTPQNMFTVVVGDVEPQYAFEKIQKAFAVEQKPRKYISYAKEKPISKQIIKTDYQPVQSGYMIIGYRSSDITSNDTYALDVLSTILGEGKSSILYKNIKENKNLAFDIDSGNATYKEDGIFTVSAGFTPENCEKLQNAVFEEMDNIIKNGVSQTQLNLAKNLIENETKYSRESISNIASQIGYTTTLSNTTKYYTEYLNNINKVSAADIQKAAKKYLTKNRAVISIVLPQEYKNLKNITQIQEADGIKKYSTDSGLTILLNQNKSNDIVAINISVKGGKFTEKIPETSTVMAGTMLKGTKKYKKENLNQIMEENGIKIYPQASSDTFSINVMTTKKHLEKTLDILNEVVNNAVFDTEEIEKYKTDKLNAIKSSGDIPINIALEGFRELIYGNSPSSISDKRYLDNYSKIQRKDILEYYENSFSPQNTVISVNGNVNIEELKELSNIFRKNGETFSYSNYTIPKITSPQKITKTQKDLGTAWIFTGWQVCGVLNQKDYAALTVIDSLLGSGMSSRLFVNLREKEGLAYQIGSSYSPKILKGAFTMYIGTNPKTLNKAKDMMLKETDRLKYEPVGEKELKEAKEKIIGRYIMSQETNLDKASQIGWFEVTGRGFDFEPEYERLINSVTPQDIQNTAKKYFNQNCVTSVIKKEN